MLQTVHPPEWRMIYSGAKEELQYDGRANAMRELAWRLAAVQFDQRDPGVDIACSSGNSIAARQRSFRPQSQCLQRQAILPYQISYFARDAP